MRNVRTVLALSLSFAAVSAFSPVSSTFADEAKKGGEAAHCDKCHEKGHHCDKCKEGKKPCKDCKKDCKACADGKTCDSCKEKAKEGGESKPDEAKK